MKHVAKHQPKHVRATVALLRRLGALRILVEIGRAYLVSWTAGSARLHISMARTAGRNAAALAWAAIRAQYRLHHLEVPAC